MLLAFVLLVGLDVVDASSAGFTSSNVVRVEAPSDAVYRALTEEVSAWWLADHTYSDDSANVSLEATAGGCLCESLSDGGSVEHLRVVYVEPGKTLRLQGGLGPLQEMAVTGSMTFTVESSGDVTQLTLTYTVGGYHPSGLAMVAEPVDGVLRAQLESLKAHAESR